MSKSGSFTLVLTVIYLSVLMSLEADAQSTTDDTKQVVNLVETTALVEEEITEKMKKLTDIQNQHQNDNEIKDVKELLVSSSSALQEVVNLVKIIASKQKENDKEVKGIASVQQEIKEQLAGNSSALKEVLNLVKRIVSVQEENAKRKNASKSCKCKAAEPSKQALVSALVSEFVSFHSTHI